MPPPSSCRGCDDAAAGWESSVGRFSCERCELSEGSSASLAFLASFAAALGRDAHARDGHALEVISKTRGHAGYAITADVCARVVPELQRDAADAMARVLAHGS